jgi:hypothetical protein
MITMKRTLLGMLTGVFFIMAVTLLPIDPLYAQDVPPPETAVEAEATEKTFAELGGDSGDTAWMIVATALVLFMTLPGLSLFYGGLVRGRNVLSILVQCFAIASLMTILWVIYGYSVAFDTTGMVKGTTNLNSFFGGLKSAFLSGVNSESVSGSIPEGVWITFQMTFAIITPALIVGAFAERMKFLSVMIFLYDLVYFLLLANLPYSLGWRRWAFLGLGCFRFRWRHCGAYQRRNCRFGDLYNAGQT